MVKYTKPDEGTGWGIPVATPKAVSEAAFPFDAKCFVNSRHQVTIHLHNVNNVGEHKSFLDAIFATTTGASARTLASDGSLIVQMSEREFGEKLGGAIKRPAAVAAV